MRKKSQAVIYEEELRQSGIIRVYNSDDYSGDLNLLVSERFLILKAFVRFRGYRKLMSQELDVSIRHLFRLFFMHDLDELFHSEYAHEKANQELNKIRASYPWMFYSDKEFSVKSRGTS